MNGVVWCGMCEKRAGFFFFEAFDSRKLYNYAAAVKFNPSIERMHIVSLCAVFIIRLHKSKRKECHINIYTEVLYIY